MSYYRQFLVILIGFITFIAPATAETILVKVNRQTSEILPRDSQLQLDLTDFFQVYEAPGPIVSFEFEAPVVDEYRDLFTGRQWNPESGAYLYDENGYALTEDTNPQNLITYKTTSGEPYNHLFRKKPQDLRTETHQVSYQLFPEDAPENVANFLGYLKRGDYEGAIIHRSEGERWRTAPGTYRLLQTGNVRRYRGDRDDIDIPFELIRARSTVPLEAARSHIAGSLGIARGEAPNSASSQFFINTSNNSGFFNNFYTVIGELIETDSLSALDDITKARHYGLGSWADSMSNAPLFTPYLYESDSYPTFTNFTVSDGSSAGISFRWEFIEPEESESEDDEEPEDPWNRDSFDISISEDGRLIVNRIDSGEAAIRIIATDSENREAEFELFLSGFNPDIISTVGSVTSAEPGERYFSTWFGNFSEHEWEHPFLDHESLGLVWMRNIGGNNRILHHNELGWISVATARFPWFYSHQFETWLFSPRATTPESQWFYKPAERVEEAEEGEEQVEQPLGEWGFLSNGELITYGQ
jgi:cyclophilin family peptidyl-prolyl cis-trans isomerase